MGKKAKHTNKLASKTIGIEKPSEGEMGLLEDGADGGDENTLKVSDVYAKKYNERKDREELTRARRILADEDADGSDSDTEPEDEAASLLTGKVEGKIFETLHKIRSKDPSIYDKSRVFFHDDDFVEERSKGGNHSSSSTRGMTYKEFLRETLLKEGADAIAKEEEEMEEVHGAKGRRKTPRQEEDDLRNSIISAARLGDVEDDQAGDLFTLKEKTKDEVQREDEKFKVFNAKEARIGEDLMARYWESSDLNNNEQFLRDYIMKQAWKESVSMQPKADGGGSDVSGDESHLDEQDEFEKEYNFRYEMDGGEQIQGHKRFQESSVRERSDKRKRQRQSRAERQGEEKVRRTEELKRLKNLKKQEIMRRLQKLQEVTGNDEIPLGAEVFDTDFDPEAHDKAMADAFNDDYDAGEEHLDDDSLLQTPAGCEGDLDVSSAASEALSRRAAGGSGGGSSSSSSKPRRVKSGNDDGNAGDADCAEDWDEPADGTERGSEEEEVDPEEWWMCDECQTGIPGGKKRFDCAVCENYTLCIKCFRVRRHPHKFVRRRVPESSMPPEDWKGQRPNRENLDKVMDEYFQMDYEDIIGGDLPTRFKYTKVTPNDCGLPLKQIFEKSDQELNRVVPLKKLRTYRTDDNKVRREAAWKWRQQGKSGVAPAATGCETSKKASSSPQGKMSASRLAAYNLQADRKRKAGGKKAKGKAKDKEQKSG